MIKNIQKKLSLVAIGFVIIVIALGAFTRLVDAGLGCPDWPGCYGFMGIPMKSETITQANQAFPEQPYELAKAWPEMVHRYFAGTLGLLVLGLFILSYMRRNETDSPVRLSFVLLALITFQAALGAWTVTEKLHPVVVMGHLLGGFATFSLLAVLSLRLYCPAAKIASFDVNRFKPALSAAIIVLVLQIALGGWTSANYAALVCTDLPICQGDWWQNADFSGGFQFWGLQADTYQYGVLGTDAMTAIHISHRVGAMITTLVILWLLMLLWKQRQTSILRLFMMLICLLLILQLALGVSNVVFHLPLSVAVAHNGIAAILLVTLVSLRTLIWLKENHD